MPEYNHPIRIAERAAVLDIVSGGRLEFGTGRSATWTELGGFRANPDSTKQSWDEFVHVIPKMWTEERFAYEGKFFSMPSRAVLPKPYQKPHPPMWVAVTSPGTDADAADRGLGYLGVAVPDFALMEKTIGEYRRRIRSCRPAGAFVNEQVNALNFLYCHEDDAVGVETGLKMARHFNYLASQLDMAKEVYATKAYPLAGLLPQLRRQASGPGDEKKVGEGLAFGDPKRISETLKRWESLGVDRVSFILNAAEIVPQEKVLESLRLFAREVMPVFSSPSSVERPGAAATGGA